MPTSTSFHLAAQKSLILCFIDSVIFVACTEDGLSARCLHICMRNVRILIMYCNLKTYKFKIAYPSLFRMTLTYNLPTLGVVTSGGSSFSTSASTFTGHGSGGGGGGAGAWVVSIGVEGWR